MTGAVDSPELFLKASPGLNITGAIYQPRGSWLTLQGGGANSGAVQIVTGALRVQGGANMNMLPLPNGITTSMGVLVE